MDSDELYAFAKELQVPFSHLKETAKLGRLEVVNFAAGGVAVRLNFRLFCRNVNLL